MSRKFKPKGISLSAGIAPCVSRCRFCQLKYHRPARYSVDRFAAIVDKYLDYKEQTGFDVSFWLGYTFNLSVSDFATLLRLHRRNGRKLDVLLLGGMPILPDAEQRRWLLERRALGSKELAGSFYGLPAAHDYLNNYSGHFEFQLRAQKIAAEIDMHNQQRLFLMRSTLRDADEILERLYKVDRVRHRIAYLLFYSGLGRKFEHERVTREMLENQPEHVKAIYRFDYDKWKTESEWVIWALEGKKAWPAHDSLNLMVTDDNITMLERASCAEVIDLLTAKTREAYAIAPGRAELAEKYGDSRSDKMYMFMWDMETLWMDRFMQANPHIKFERRWTHFGR